MLGRRSAFFLYGALLIFCIASIFLAIIYNLGSTGSYISPSVSILQGNLQGEILTTRKNRHVYSFRSIPYAEAPIGTLRFQAPVAAKSWTGTLLATTESNICPQLVDGTVAGDEDCLYLNVYTPQLSATYNSALLPVMVYIHGGGFEKGNGGSSLYGPRFLLDADVLLVTLNYRLGPLGFLSTGDNVVPGNNGLKDQVMALKWVQSNIEYFGGDPEQVTIFGQSVGGCSVHLLALSNLTDGLFHQYITQSGSALSIRGYRPRDIYKDRAFELGDYLGCPTNTSSLLVSCLMELNVTDIIETKPSFYVWRNFPDIVWGPTDEEDTEGAFLTASPKDLYEAGKARDLPWMNGDVRDGGLLLSGDFYAHPDKFEDFLTNFDDVLPHILQYDMYLENVTAHTDALKSYYFNDDLTTNRSMLLSNFTDLLSDSFFTFPIYDSIKKQLALAKNPVYFYYFEYRGTYSNSYRYTNGSTDNYGVAHNDELLYLFSQTQQLFGVPDTEMSADDFEMVDVMVDLWSTFASGGIPETSVLNGTSNWKQYSSRDNYLQIGNEYNVELSNQYSFLTQRMQFWENLTSTGEAK